MSYTPFVVERFGGLNLVDDPEEVGPERAIDLLNVDLDKRGTVRSRDGYDNFTASPAVGRLESISPYYRYGGTKQAIVSTGSPGLLTVYSTAGAVVASTTIGGLDTLEADFARFGGPSVEAIYVTSLADLTPLANVPKRWNGSSWTTALLNIGGLGPYPYALEVHAGDNRLVGAFHTSNSSRIGFSDAGVPETFSANNYVDLTPGDGEAVTALVSWRELVFVFKETKFFIFGTTSTAGDGNPIFNYRPVSAGVGAIGRQCATATPSGVYFLSRRGVYRTTGDDPVLVSRAIDPIFRGGASTHFAGGVLNHAAITKCRLTWHDERLYFAYPSGSSTTNDRLFVFDPESDQWTLWDIAVNSMTSFRPGDGAELLFTYPTGSNHVGRASSAYTTDDGVAITSRYKSGFYELSKPGSDTYTRSTRLLGTGTPTLSVYTNHGTTDSNAAAVTLGTSPAVVEGVRSLAYKGRQFSHGLSSTSGAWSVNRLIHDVAWTRP